jgi:hypothetical protein
VRIVNTGRELVTENGVSAAGARTEVIENVPLTPPPVTPALTVAALVQALKFGSRPPLMRPIRRRDEPPAYVQFSLF